MALTRPRSLIVAYAGLCALLSTATARAEGSGEPQPATGDAALDEPGAGGGSEAEAAPAESSPDSAPPARARRGPASPFQHDGTRVGRLSFALAAGWPDARLEIEYAATEIFTATLRVGYAYGSPQPAFDTTSAMHFGLGTRLALLRRDRLELTFGASAVFVLGLDPSLTVTGGEVYLADAEIATYAVGLDLDLTLAWSLSDALSLRFGLSFPALLALVTVERPGEDGWELTVPFAARVGVAFRALSWLQVFATIDAGPALVAAPSAWLSSGYERDVGVDVFLRALAGVALTPF